MAIIQEEELFVWSDLDISSDLSRLSMILNTIPDENLMKVLEDERGSSGVNPYSVRAIWSSLFIEIIVEHSTIESLRRELQRNPALCQVCGFDIYKGSEAVPRAGCYSHFIKN